MTKNIGVFLLAAAGMSAAVSSMAGFAQSTRRSTDPPLPPRGKLGQELFLALDHRDLSQVKALLEKGADPNARNGLEFTPLYVAAASHQTDVMEVLLQAGASNSTQTSYGTPLSFASLSGNVEGAKLLLSQNVQPDVPRTDGMTPLMLAANVGCTPTVADLISAKANVNAQDDGGETALAQAARNGFSDTVKTLIAAGADVNLADSQGETPLMLAATNGQTGIVKLLISHGAHPNATDNDGRSPLLLAASYGDYPDVLHALCEGGARAELKEAAKTAAQHGYTGACKMLSVQALPAAAASPRTAIKRSLPAIQASMAMFSTEAKCVSCHQEGLGRITTGEAASHGYTLDEKVRRIETARITGMVAAMQPLHAAALKSDAAMKQIPLIEINEVSDTYGWLLSGMVAQGQPRTAATAAMAMCLAHQQSADGSWTFSVPRVPMQSSVFTFTALAVHALEAYGPEDHHSEISQRVALAKAWLLKSRPQNSEDRASRLLGLNWSAGGAQARRAAAAAILADQLPDGGWSQVPGGHSDAYATGQALYALRVGGKVSTSDPAWHRGVRYLLRTQDADGTWFVNKRAMPANNYFSVGFPHGESQYASFNGTCWAVLALLQVTG